MRNDNELLTLATNLRDIIKYENWEKNFRLTNSSQIINYASEAKFILAIEAITKTANWHETKVIAWRNKCVSHYNDIIRHNLGYKEVYCKNDIILIAEPIELRGNIIAHIDDEFTILNVAEDKLKVDDYYIDTWRLEVDGYKQLTLQIPRKISLLNILLNEKATYAKNAKGKDRLNAWRDFWQVKRRFHNIKYGYALTAHRSQGSTFQEQVFVDSLDILSNGNKKEAHRCLYVAVTRPSNRLHLL
jgi:hypothetical protein